MRAVLVWYGQGASRGRQRAQLAAGRIPPRVVLAGGGAWSDLRSRPPDWCTPGWGMPQYVTVAVLVGAGQPAPAGRGLDRADRTRAPSDRGWPPVSAPCWPAAAVTRRSRWCSSRMLRSGGSPSDRPAARAPRDRVGGMLRVGLTGGIGSGKSTVAQRFSSSGRSSSMPTCWPARWSHPAARGSRPSSTGSARGSSTTRVPSTGPALGAIVFADGRSRRDLEGITHPLIARRTAELVAAAPDGRDRGARRAAAGGEELRTGLPPRRGRRGRRRDAGEAAHAHARDDRGRRPQPDRRPGHRPERREAADVWLENDGPKDDLLAAVDELWHGGWCRSRRTCATAPARGARNSSAWWRATPRGRPRPSGCWRGCACLRRRARHRRPRREHRGARPGGQGRHRPPGRGAVARPTPTTPTSFDGSRRPASPGRRRRPTTTRKDGTRVAEAVPWQRRPRPGRPTSTSVRSGAPDGAGP